MPGPRAAGAPLDGALGAGRDFHRWNVRWNEFSTASARRRESPSLLPQAEAPKKNFVRGEWVVGRGLGLLRGPSSGWCVRCSPGSESLENGGPADSRRQWLGLETARRDSFRPSKAAVVVRVADDRQIWTNRAAQRI